jgi:hypothetical protein
MNKAIAALAGSGQRYWDGHQSSQSPLTALAITVAVVSVLVGGCAVASAGPAHASVVVGGETLYDGDFVACMPQRGVSGSPNRFLMDHIDPKGATVTLTSSDTPQVEQVALFAVDGYPYTIYDRSALIGGPAYVVKNGDSYTISGSALNDRYVSKHFEIHITNVMCS